jgi:hypothetical protein
MTVENYEYRTDPMFLRNQFNGTGKFQIPQIPKFIADNDDFTELKLIGYDKISTSPEHYGGRMVHFFLYDYKFEKVWSAPDKDLDLLKQYRAVLSPDFSMYTDMPEAIQLYNTFRNRWCGAYYADKGIRVIPTVNWGNENTFDFCFEGVAKGSVVAVSTYMVSESPHRKAQKEFFLKGYNEMLKRIEPEKIICYHTPFEEMQGDIIFIDYELSSWRYMTEHLADKKREIPSDAIYKTCRNVNIPKQSENHIKVSYGNVFKGSGAAAGGGWKPSKEADERLLGEPGQIKDSGYRQDYIGETGKAVIEKHNADHGNTKVHDNPHYHQIDWSKGIPNPGKAINKENPLYKWAESFFTNEEKSYKKENITMKVTKFQENTPEQNRFTSIGDFKWAIECHSEIQFDYKGKAYSLLPTDIKQVEATLRGEQMYISDYDGTYFLGEGYYVKDNVCYNIKSNEEYSPSNIKYANTADKILDLEIDGVRLRDIITTDEVLITERTI